MTEFRIEKLVAGGYSLARDQNGLVNFLTGGYPGELVDAEKIQTSKGMSLWKTIKVIQPSSQRCQSSCNNFPECGGCDWQDLQYDAQVEWKSNIIREQFRRIGKMELPGKLEVVPSIHKNYRNRMEYLAFKSSGRVKLGFYRKLSKKPVVSDGCVLGLKPFEEIKRAFGDIFSEINTSVYDWHKKRGVLKHLVLRGNREGEIMAVVVTSKDEIRFMEKVSELVNKRLPEVTSLINVLNSNDEIVLRGPHRIMFGDGVLTEKIGWLTYQIPPTSFFQNNPFIVSELLDYVKNVLEPDASENLLDLYCGVGTFSIFLAPNFRSVTGVESVKTSTNALKANCNINDLHNIKTVNSASEDFIENPDRTYEKVIHDPPRGGRGKDVGNLLLTGARMIAYVSCNAATLARDVGYLLQNDFILISIKGFDMFPQTHHVETVCLLRRK